MALVMRQVTMMSQWTYSLLGLCEKNDIIFIYKLLNLEVCENSFKQSGGPFMIVCCCS